MKYLKEYNEHNMDFVSISNDEYNNFVYDDAAHFIVKDSIIELTTAEIDTIKKINMDNIFIEKDINKKSIAITLDDEFILYVYKDNDEYYYVKNYYNIVPNKLIQYKCDQLHGLIEFIKNILKN